MNLFDVSEDPEDLRTLLRLHGAYPAGGRYGPTGELFWHLPGNGEAVRESVAFAWVKDRPAPEGKA